MKGDHAMLMGKTLTWSNALSFLRILLLIPIYLSLRQNTLSGNVWALYYMLMAALSDFLDGFLARKLNQVSDLGKTLDPIADKICIIAVCLFLASPERINPIPVWVIALIFFRDVLIVSGGVLVYTRFNFVITSNIWGKLTSGVLAAWLISCTLQYESSSPWLFWINSTFLLRVSLILLMISAITYAWRFWGLFKGQSTIFRKPEPSFTQQTDFQSSTTLWRGDGTPPNCKSPTNGNHS
ncbi:MAG: CDP-alcohol phosphatidyltransferase family protein [bacterium]